MSEPPLSFIVFPGAGGGIPKPTTFAAQSVGVAFQTVRYPTWQRYGSADFTAQDLVAELAAQVEELAPHGSVQIVGISVGGHLGYAVALRLQSRGRKIGGFCAIDSYMIDSPDLASGWITRAFGRSWELLRNGRTSDFSRYLRRLLWRAMFRLPGGRLPDLLSKLAPWGHLPTVSGIDPLFERELTMRLLIRKAAPWVPSLDNPAAPLSAPASLIRTSHVSADDDAWKRRCPDLEIFEVPGHHLSLLEPENADPFRAAFAAAKRRWQTTTSAQLLGS